MKRENKRFGETDYFFNTTSEDSPFSSDITPLILAAERNQFEIVQLLLLRGETIRKPHHYYCNCQECSNKLVFDQLRLAKTRLNAYRGLASSAYISLSSNDPILTAFELARELRCVAKVEKYYKVRIPTTSSNPFRFPIRGSSILQDNLLLCLSVIRVKFCTLDNDIL